jgi:hypothetical protein
MRGFIIYSFLENYFRFIYRHGFYIDPDKLTSQRIKNTAQASPAMAAKTQTKEQICL